MANDIAIVMSREILVLFAIISMRFNLEWGKDHQTEKTTVSKTKLTKNGQREDG